MWVKNRYQKRNTSKWKQGLNPAVPWWFNFDPCPYLLGIDPLDGRNSLSGWPFTKIVQSMNLRFCVWQVENKGNHLNSVVSEFLLHLLAVLRASAVPIWPLTGRVEKQTHPVRTCLLMLIHHIQVGRHAPAVLRKAHPRNMCK